MNVYKNNNNNKITKKMNLLTQNAKMKKTSKENNTKIFNFRIPSNRNIKNTRH